MKVISVKITSFANSVPSLYIKIKCCSLIVRSSLKLENGWTDLNKKNMSLDSYLFREGLKTELSKNNGTRAKPGWATSLIYKNQLLFVSLAKTRERLGRFE